MRFFAFFSSRPFVRAAFAIAAAASLAFAPVPASAQDGGGSAAEEDSSWYYGKPLKSVTFRGLKNTSERDLDGVSSGFRGKPFTDELFGELVDRLYALDLFDEISPEAVPGDSRRSTVSIVFNVTERPAVRRIVVRGNSGIRTAEVKDAISMKEKDIFVAARLPADERAIRALYLEKGYTSVKVSSSTEETDKGVVVTFHVEEGRNTVITKIDFTGNKVASARTLRGQCKLKEAGFFSKGAFQESTLEADKQAIVFWYMNKGYADAAILDVTKDVEVNEEKGRDELTITFHVQEGPQYTFAGIEFVGNEIFDDEKLFSRMRLKAGEVLNQAKLQESFQLIADLYYESGYTSNRFTPVPSKDAEAKTVFYTFNIEENARSHVESVTVKGNNKTKEQVITREIPLEAGDVFSKAKITTGLRNLYNLQYFSAVVPEIVPGSEENLVNVVFSVEEQSTTSIEFGVTFSGVSDPDDLPFALFAKWQDSNLRGTGKALAVSTTIATDEQSLNVSLSENWLWGLPVYGSVSTGFSHANLSALRLRLDGDGGVDSSSYYMDYEQWRWTLGFSLGRRWTPDWAILSAAAGLTFSLKNNIYDSDLWIPLDTTVSRYANSWGWQNSVWASFSVDDRNINYDPSTGWFASQRLTWYGLMPFETEYFLRSDTKLEKYFTLLDLKVTESWDFRLVLAGYTGLSLLFPAPDTGIGDTSKLYIDGMFNGRGWTNIYNKVRGKAMWCSNIELRIPVVPGVLALDWFGDAAVVKESRYALFNDLSLGDFYFSTGPGVRFTIPQFPLRLLFANTFRVQDGSLEWDKTWKFVLSFNLTNK